MVFEALEGNLMASKFFNFNQVFKNQDETWVKFSPSRIDFDHCIKIKELQKHLIVFLNFKKLLFLESNLKFDQFFFKLLKTTLVLVSFK